MAIISFFIKEYFDESKGVCKKDMHQMQGNPEKRYCEGYLRKQKAQTEAGIKEDRPWHVLRA